MLHNITQATYPPGIERAALTAGIFGLATHKVYPPDMSPCRTVGSYPTFSPLPVEAQVKAGLTLITSTKAVVFCGTCCSCKLHDLPAKKYGALCCPDFPLPDKDQIAIEQSA